MTDIKKYLNILIVEDDLEIQENLMNTLILLFKNVFTANDGIEALKIIDNEHIDMILTDYVMPNMDAFDFITTIRKSNLEIPILVLSSFMDIQKLQKCIPLGLLHFLEKPISFDRLLEEINKGINNLDIKYQLTQNCTYYKKRALLKVDEEYTKLTLFENRVLELLCLNKSEIIEINSIISYLGDENVDKNTIKNIVYRLRKKIPNINIISHRNIGYSIKYD
ncbi:transcriptional regulator [Malaciobacter marinus]|jgi:DNA-binding response OmpR family regulator|uniref:Transcriptional regulator n=1 Tax=Malaciobacter marinus TaxID=505249 RepID=A0AB36ZUC6_9BACT|nr:response regulator [Malaciobacter marinus]PPK57798.1 transcriptional regulator [Malaciobacter marinus]